jgi:preprotein translocase SecE subunit
MAKDINNAENNQKKDKKDKKNGEKRRFRRTRETFAELKKVTWPSFSVVVKSTGIVLLVVIAFLIALFAFDMALTYGVHGPLTDTSEAIGLFGNSVGEPLIKLTNFFRGGI